MKFIKYGVLALALGLFTVSCGESATEDDTTMEDSSMNAAPMAEPTMATPDTMMAAPAAGTDTMMMNGGSMNSGSTMDTMKK